MSMNRTRSSAVPASGHAVPGHTKHADHSSGTGLLLGLGVAAGPVGVLLVVAQMFTVGGFDPRRHTISYLALGPSGWAQTLMFLLTGILYALSAVGLRRTLAGSRGGRWAPIFVAVLGLSFICAGAFPMDPADGFPPGTPDGPTMTPTWHGTLHEVAPVLASVALIGSSAVLARRNFALRRPGVAVAYLAVIALDLLPIAFAGTDMFFAVTTATQLTAWMLFSGLLGVMRRPVTATAGVSR